MTVLIARDGRSAINLTRRVNPDVILMDAVMPGMGGFEACRELKSGPQPVLAPIVFMTGLSDKEHILEGLAAGGVDYVTKPVIVEELIARLTTHIINSRLLHSARAALDSSGRSVLAFNPRGDLLWGSEKALGLISFEDGAALTPLLAGWVRTCATLPTSQIVAFNENNLSFEYVGMTGATEILIKVLKAGSASNEGALIASFDLTPREAEVLYWLTLGKTNRDIGVILELSARTVNKHLEQVFQKMGVDNRTTAAVIADRILNLNA